MEYGYVKSNTEQAVSRFNDMLLAGTPAVFFDFETTGVQKSSRIIQIGAMKVGMDADGVLTVLDTFNELVDPGFHIPEEASAVNQIYDEDVAGHMDEAEACRRFREFLGPLPLLAGYNSVSFDEKYLNAMYLRQTGEEFHALMHLDICVMAREKLILSSYKLQEVAHELGCDIGVSFHDAFDDIKATVRVFTELVPLYAPRDAALPILPVTGYHYVCHSHTVNRVYVGTYPRTKTYYDIYRKKWVSDMDIDLERLREDTLRYAGVDSEKALIQKAKS